MTVIAISCAYDGDKDRAMLHMGYVRSIFEAGATPIMVNMDKKGFKLPRVDGLVLSGGGDISPFFFARKPTEKTGEIQYERDVFELSLIEQCRDLPILGICRGMQVLNVAYGGTLFDHIDGHDLEYNQRHDIYLARDSRLYQVLGCEYYPVNSIHHQSIERAGNGFRICATSEDGVIEAIEHEEKYHFGVQWHPEKMGDKRSEKLFEFFVNLCNEQK